MKPSVRIALGFAVLSTLCLIASWLIQNNYRIGPELMEPILVFVGVPALVFAAGFGLAAIIKGGKEL